MSYSILIVEDEINLLKATVRGLESIPDVDVDGCGSAEEALHILTSSVPDLLVLDINLPGISGLDLLEDLAARKLDLPVIVVTAYRLDNQEHLDRHAGLTILEKPVPIKELRREVQAQLEPSASDLSAGPFQVSDYIQLASLGRHSLTLDATLDDGRLGRVEIWAGEIWNATLGDLAGLEALAQLVLRPASQIRNTGLEEEPARRQIKGSSENVLLEIARLHDEAAAGADELSPDLEMTPFDEDIEQLFADAIGAYLERDLERALELLTRCHDLQPGDRRVQSAIAKIERRRERS